MTPFGPAVRKGGRQIGRAQQRPELATQAAATRVCNQDRHEAWRGAPHTFAAVAGHGRWRGYPWLEALGRRVYGAIGRGRGRLIVNAPPQHGKSELVSRRFPAFMSGRNSATSRRRVSMTTAGRS